MLRLVHRVRVGWLLLESGLARKISLCMMIELIVVAYSRDERCPINNRGV
jgi:hypothetical protein